ncbi:PDGLE domain-containing protein [Actinomadura sp. WAC 06369]|uniref:PDGLE domain-containing protein n=1 Tax=Actinomadura sp. WAC 06369 TaxID=2203193 RepID=UPI0018F6D8CC|nr:PDGLE domain-containing protein [Actinomadura sp. WAC 06369]
MRTKYFFAGFLIVSLVLAGIVSHYASSSPDGLEKVAADKGIAAQEEEHALAGSPLGDYGVEGVDDGRLSGGLAGLIGVGLTLAAGGGLFWAIRRRGGGEPDAEPAAGAGTAARTD